MSHGMTDKDTMVSGSGIEPWHYLETQGRTKIVAHCMTAEEAIRESGLAWGVGKELIRTDSGIVIPGYKRTYRLDNGDTLGVVGDDYHVINNTEAFSFVDSLLSSGDVRFETAGSLYGGKRIYILAHLPDDLFVCGEKIKQFFLLTSAHTGEEAVICQTTPIRVVCQNTLNAALRGVQQKARITHVGNYEAQIAEARRTLGFTKSYYKSFAEMAEDLARQLFTRASFEDMLKTLLPTPDEASKQLVTMRRNQHEKLIQCWQAPDLENVRETKWGAYNAVADYADHGRTLRGTPEERAERAFIRTFENTNLKNQALEILSAK